MPQIVLILGLAFFITLYAIVRLVIKHNSAKAQGEKK